MIAVDENKALLASFYNKSTHERLAKQYQINYLHLPE